MLQCTIIYTRSEPWKCAFACSLSHSTLHRPLGYSTPPLPVIRHVCARLTDLSSNQTSFRLHLTPFPREQPPQWRSPGNHPLISEVSVCIIVFTLSSDTQSLAYLHSLRHGHTHAPTVTYSNVLLNIFEKESASILIHFAVKIHIAHYVFFICIHKHSLYCCQKVVLKCVAQADPRKPFVFTCQSKYLVLICYRLYSVKTKQREENSQTQRIKYVKRTRIQICWVCIFEIITCHSTQSTQTVFADLKSVKWQMKIVISLMATSLIYI